MWRTTLAAASAYAYGHTMTSTTQSIAAEVRAELARHQRRGPEVARALDCSPSTISRKLNGRVPFTVAELVTIANLLGIDAGRFYSTDTAASHVDSPSAFTDVA